MLATTLVVGTITALATGTYFYIRPRAASNRAFQTFRCAQCGQKLRFLASKAGRAGMCPRCRKQWTLPAHAQMAAAGAVKVGQRLMTHSARQIRAAAGSLN